MSDQSVADKIRQTATEICKSTGCIDLFDSQLSYWLSVQNLMKSGGYDEVRKRMPHVSETLATAIAASPLKNIRNLCSMEIATLKPSLPDSTIHEMLNPAASGESDSRYVLQLLSN